MCPCPRYRFCGRGTRARRRAPRPGRRLGSAGSGRMRRPALPDPPRRHLAVSRQPDRAEGTGLPVRLRAASARRTAASGWRRRPSAGASRSRTCRSSPSRLDWCGCGRNQSLTFRTNVDKLITRRARASDPRRARHPDLRADAVPASACAGPTPPRSRRASAAPSITSWSRWASRGCGIAGRCWASGAAACFFPLGEMPADDAAA